MNWVKLRIASDGGLLCSAGSRPFEEVRVRHCLPLSHPDGFLALLGKDGREVALVESPVSLDLESRRALGQVLGGAGFLIAVTAVFSIESAGELFIWKIDSAQGSRTIQTRGGDWPRSLEDGGSLVEDVSGDLYRLPPLALLDTRSRRALKPFVG